VLAEHALETWGGKVGWVLGLDLPEAGQLVQSRITGAFDGIRRLLPDLPVESFVRIDGRGMREVSNKLVSDFLKRHPHEANILIAAATDSSALGALDAVRVQNREREVAIVGQDCIEEVTREIADPDSALIGSVSHEAHLYGDNLIRLGLGILHDETIAPYNYVTHRMVTRERLAAV
jgi:ribose transport system substrate-binding protein